MLLATEAVAAVVLPQSGIGDLRLACGRDAEWLRSLSGALSGRRSGHW